MKNQINYTNPKGDKRGKKGTESTKHITNMNMPALGIYIHWPFCSSKCPYCDFNSHVHPISTALDEPTFVDAYVHELQRYATITNKRSITSVFFGGGTPSLMHPSSVDRLLSLIARLWPLETRAEITLEANPASFDVQKFADFRAVGVNRVSLGVQSLYDADLRALGRTHSAKEACDALAQAHKIFPYVSCDLIYARQHQTIKAWQKELSIALDLAGTHLSLYQLTIEPNTVFAKRAQAGHLRGLPNTEQAADFYICTDDMCTEAGFCGYEISNYARKTHKGATAAQSQHNLLYWRGQDYIGVGPGAHGRLTVKGVRYATECYKLPAVWQQSVLAHSTGESIRTRLSAWEQASEYLLMALRLHEGADMGHFAALLGLGLPDQGNNTHALWHGLDDSVVTDLQKNGLIERDQQQMRATRNGRLLLNSILAALLNTARNQ